MFDDFDIGCETGTLLDIEFTKENRRNYCNKNKPIQALTSVEDRITMLFRLNRVAYFLMEGFSARYETLEKGRTVITAVIDETFGKYKAI